VECATAADCLSTASILAASGSARDRAQAKAVFARASRLAPHAKEAWLGLGALSQDEGDFEGAALHLSRALRAEACCWRAGINIGNLAAMRGDMASAARAYRHVLRCTPHVPQAWYALAFVRLLQGSPPAACALMQRAWGLKSDLYSIPGFAFVLDGAPYTV